MDTAKLNDWMQVIGIFAVVASLIFVGLQMKQTQEIALSAAYQARASIVAEVLAANAANENGLAAWYKPTTDGLDSLTPAEEWAGSQMTNSSMYLWDNVHYQITIGFISAEYLPGLRADVKSSMRLPFIRRHLDSRLGRLRPAFSEFIIELGEELDAEAGE